MAKPCGEPVGVEADVRAWLESEEGKRCTDGAAFGLAGQQEEYLRRRILKALTAGIEIGRWVTIAGQPEDSSRFDSLSIRDAVDLLIRRAMRRFRNYKPDVAAHLGVSLKTIYTRLEMMRSRVHIPESSEA